MSHRGRGDRRSPVPGVALGDEERQLLARHRARQHMPAALQEEIWQRLETSIAQGDAAPLVSEAPTRTRARWPWVAAAAAACVGALLLLRGELWTRAEDEGVTPMQAPSQVLDERPVAPMQPGSPQPGKVVSSDSADELPSFPAPSDRARAEDRDLVQTAEEPSSAKKRPASVRRRKTAPDEPSDKAVPSLSEELALLRQAQTALARGQTDRVLAMVAKHRKAFPASVLGPERDALAVLARCSASPEPAASAQKAARAYLQQHGGSPHAARVQRVCLP